MRPVVPTLSTIGGATQVRMVAQPRTTTITRHSAPVRIQGPISVPRLANASVSQIRTPSGATIIQQHPGNIQLQSNPPALHPVSQNAFTAPGGAQVITSMNLAEGRLYNSFSIRTLDSGIWDDDSTSGDRATSDAGFYKTTECGIQSERCRCRRNGFGQCGSSGGSCGCSTYRSPH